MLSPIPRPKHESGPELNSLTQSPLHLVLTWDDLRSKRAHMFLGQANITFLQWLTAGKDALSIVQSIATVAGIIIGGIWTYTRFIKGRQGLPRANLEHRVEAFSYNNAEWHVRVGLTIKNESQVLLKIQKGHTWIQQIEPYSGDVVDELKTRAADINKPLNEARWPLIEERLYTEKTAFEIEPLETHNHYMDFFIPKTFQKILVYTFLENSAKPGQNIGWTASTVVDLTTGKTTEKGQGKGSDKPRPQPVK